MSRLPPLLWFAVLILPPGGRDLSLWLSCVRVIYVCVCVRVRQLQRTRRRSLFPRIVPLVQTTLLRSPQTEPRARSCCRRTLLSTSLTFSPYRRRYHDYLTDWAVPPSTAAFCIVNTSFSCKSVLHISNTELNYLFPLLLLN